MPFIAASANPRGQHPRAIAIWLAVCAAMIAVMVILGGATRLTHSGLSMVEWKPLSVLPPLTTNEWQAAFQDYQHYPEFIKKNSWMGLDDFKAIYWLEYSHRLWGRLIGAVFLLPLVWFAARRMIDRALAGKLAVIFVLGGFQGALGWFMVASGLEARPDVSQYRLAAHLVSAFVLYAFIVWLALDEFRAARGRERVPEDATLANLALVLAGYVLVVAAAGALTAGLKAGLIYNTFPLMDGQWMPPGGMKLNPWYLNFFENIATVQFDHRILAVLLVAAVLATWQLARHRVLTVRARVLVHALLAMVIVQAGLGIATLLLVVPMPLALVHQLGALVLFTLALSFAHEVREPSSSHVVSPVSLSIKPAE